MLTSITRRGGPVLMVALLMLFAATAWGAVTGVISGTITDAATGAPLSGANVAVAGTGLATVTGSDGRFVITNIAPGIQTLRVGLIGYRQTEVSEIVVVQGQATPVEIALEQTVVEAAGAEARVTAPRVSLKPEVTSSVYVVTAADEQLTLSQPNDRYQFPGLVFAQPGVTPDSTFYPHIRGARVNQVGYYLDGIPITEPDANVFATNIVSIGLDRMELFTGGYPAEYGGWTGGIINQVVKRGDQMMGGLVDVSAGSPYNYGGLLLETGNVDGRANWYYGQYNWHTELPDNLFTSAAPTVSDHIAKVIYDVGARDSITLLAHHGYARYLMPWERMFTFDPKIDDWIETAPGDSFGRQGDNIVALTLNHTISPQSFWTARLSRLDHYLQLELGDLSNMYWQHRNERMLTGQFDYEAQMGDHRLRTGLWQLNSDNNSQYSVYLMPVKFYSNNDTQNMQAYAQDTWRLNKRTALSLGLRYESMNYDRPAAGNLKLDETSGRAGLTYQLSDRALLRGGYGRYIQFPRANLVAYEFSGMDIGWYDILAPAFPAQAQLDRGMDLGLEWKLDGSTLLNATWFDRQSRRMTQRWQGVLHDENGDWILDDEGHPILSDNLSDFDPDAPVWFAANGTGEAQGLEVKLDRKITDNLRAWTSYTYLNATATSPRDNIYPFGYGFLNQTDTSGLAQEFRPEWSQQHTAVLAADYKCGKLSINPWATYGSGFPYGQSGLDAGGSDPAHVPNPNYDPGDPGSGPEEYTVPENYLDPANPSAGFVNPDTLETGKNLTLSLNLAYQVREGCEAYLQIFNLLGRDDVTSYVLYHPQTGALMGQLEGDNIYYVPFAKTPPRFFAFGIRQEW